MWTRAARLLSLVPRLIQRASRRLAAFCSLVAAVYLSIRARQSSSYNQPFIRHPRLYLSFVSLHSHFICASMARALEYERFSSRILSFHSSQPAGMRTCSMSRALMSECATPPPPPAPSDSLVSSFSTVFRSRRDVTCSLPGQEVRQSHSYHGQVAHKRRRSYTRYKQVQTTLFLPLCHPARVPLTHLPLTATFFRCL